MCKNCIKKALVVIAFFSVILIGKGTVGSVTMGTDLYVSGGNVLFAEEIILGGRAGWTTFQKEKNISRGKGRFGYESIEIAPNSFVYDDYTDLLIDFENPVNPISDGNYEIVQNALKVTDKTLMEKRAGLSRNLGSLGVKGKPGTFFGSEGIKGSFSLEFWLCPSISENGEIIFDWKSSKNVKNRLVYQMINASFKGGHLEWTLTNLFDIYSSYVTNPRNLNEIVLKGTSNIIPDEWSYHCISYDCETGILEYLVNGITEDLLYVTSTGEENGETFLVLLGTPSEVQFCSEYTGGIDDIRLLRRPYSPPDFQSAERAGKLEPALYVPSGARFETVPVRLSTGAVINRIDAIVDIPPQTEICLFVRSSDNFYNWTDSYPEWKPVENGEEIKNVSGLYCQIAAELYPDGEGSISPSITEIKIDYTQLPLPLPPFLVKAVAGNGKVTVSWNYSVDNTAGGYYLYYGTRPGEYLGRIALEGESPINVGNTTSFTVTGLENGRIYYFAVASWSNQDERIVGNLSKEVYARPLERLK